MLAMHLADEKKTRLHSIRSLSCALSLQEYTSEYGTGEDCYTISTNILHSIQTNWPSCDSKGPFKRNIRMELREDEWRRKAEDADVQITA